MIDRAEMPEDLPGLPTLIGGWLVRADDGTAASGFARPSSKGHDRT
jgi:hypothetical protein